VAAHVNKLLVIFDSAPYDKFKPTTVKTKKCSMKFLENGWAGPQ
jgi:hypothetical protein